MSDKNLNNHSVSRVFQKRFAKRSGRSYTVKILDLSLKNGGYRNTRSALYVNGLYNDKLEHDIAHCIEDRLDKPISKLIKASEEDGSQSRTISLKRDEVDFFRKTLLIQMIRTPSSLEKLNNILISEGVVGANLFSEDRFPGESTEDFWLRIISDSINRSWSDMDKTCSKWVNNMVSAINCMSPLLISTNTDLILPDTGFFYETCEFYDDGRRMTDEESLRLYGKRIDSTQKDKIAGSVKKYANFFGLPVGRHTALLFVDDNWNIYRMAKDMCIPVNEILSSVLSEQLVGSKIHYATPGIEWKPVHGFDSESVHDENDVFEIPIKKVSDETTYKINSIIIDQCQRFIVFHDHSDINDSLEYYEQNGTAKDVSFHNLINYDEPYSDDTTK